MYLYVKQVKIYRILLINSMKQLTLSVNIPVQLLLPAFLFSA